jgi:hypothetical protein
LNHDEQEVEVYCGDLSAVDCSMSTQMDVRASFGPAYTDFMRVASGAFGSIDDMVMDGSSHFVGYLANRPAACVSVRMENGGAKFYNLGVIPEFRDGRACRDIFKYAVKISVEAGAVLGAACVGRATERMVKEFGFERAAT